MRESEPAPAAAQADQAEALLALYDRALPDVYGYLVRRCANDAIAEDLTAETFLAAVTAVKRGRVPTMTAAWLIAVARNKLVDHWRRAAREERGRRLVADRPAAEDLAWPHDHDWADELDEARALAVLAELGPHHRSVLTLRYLDGLSVPEVAEQIDRTVHATEALLVRARVAFRKMYGERSHDAS